MKTKVKSVQQDGTWDGKDGTLFYKHEYVFDDDVVMSASHKSVQPFKAGDEVEYEIKKDHETYGKSGTVKKPNDFKKGGFDTKGVECGHAMNNAVNMVCAGVELETVTDYKNSEEKIIKYAEWVLKASDYLKAKR